MAKASRECPCGSGLRYAACCAPLHAGAREAETPEALMRSRFAAFALGLGDYLVRTLAKTHADRAHPRVDLARLLSRAKDTQRFLGLRIVRAHEVASDEGEVLFVARVFERGADRSFAELSRFVREDGAWRYESGVTVPASKLPPPRELEAITRDAFASLAVREQNDRP